MAEHSPGAAPNSLLPRPASGRLRCVLAGAFVLLVACFAGKPAHIDDPLFLWAARHVLDDPLRPYDLLVNWYRTPTPLSAAMQNPPLVAYWLAGGLRWLGGSTAALHLSMLAFPAALALGVWELAARRCSRPALATALALATPAVLVSATSLMCDIPMLALWVWGLAAWDRGEEGRGRAWFALAGLLLALGVLTKYYAAAAVPLLATYSLARHRRLRPELLWLALPLAALAGYQVLSRQLYGDGALSQAMGYSLGLVLSASPLERALLATAFLGGTLLPAAVFLPLLGPAPGRRGRAAFALALGLGLAGAAALFALTPPRPAPFPWWAYAQGAACLAAGLHLLVLALRRDWRRPDPEDLLLALGVLGPWLFAAGANWTVNARSVLPAAPFLGILLARALEDRAGAPARLAASPRVLAGFLALGLALSLALAWADLGWAVSARTAARVMAERFPPRERGSVIFLGHWGFQYYMEAEGFTAFDLRGTRLAVGDRVIAPANNLDTPLPWSLFEREEDIRVPACSFAALRTPQGFAGFYTSVNGPLPWLFGPAPDELYAILRARQAIIFE